MPLRFESSTSRNRSAAPLYTYIATIFWMNNYKIEKLSTT